jgi:hypothetical protein
VKFITTILPWPCENAWKIVIATYLRLRRIVASKPAELSFIGLSAAEKLVSDLGPISAEKPVKRYIKTQN